jgi:enoyl-CoA hydratase/carnithine racemase
VAKRLILGAEVIDGAQAAELSVVHWAYPRAELAMRASDLAARIAAMPKPALAAAKRCIAATGDSKRDGFAEEIEATRLLYGDAETRGRVAKFLNKRSKEVS